MKTRRLIVSATLALWAGVGAVWAQDIEMRIISQLQAEGYVHIEVTRTWLGRVRIEAEGPGIEREIIFNPNTGEILRDYWEVDDDNHSGGVLSSSGTSGPNSGSGQGSGGFGGGDDDEDGEDEEEEEDEDEEDEQDEEDDDDEGDDDDDD